MARRQTRKRSGRSDPARTVLVTGANRGLGFETARALALLGHRVILTGRDPEGVTRAAARLRDEGLEASTDTLDVSRPDAAERLAAKLWVNGVHVDVLVNNAAVYHQGGVLAGRPAVFEETFAVNFFGALWTCRAFVPAMVRAGYGRVVNVSSGSGAFAEDLEGPAAYCMSKAALNALTRKLAAEVHGDVKVNAVCPGWVRTRMGGRDAELSVEQGADTIVWLATLPERGPHGGLYRERRRIRW